ncbi:uncharacterized protein [Nicotiana tomentosiformis]|uniref:uncharacterized protein n=1 Tax=Nicotiana tomentosiformis TaxID=4098 RepID=UPI00388CBA89
MNDGQVNYTVTEKELLAIVFAMEKFRPYVMGAKVIMHTDHTALRYLMTKKDSKARLMRWLSYNQRKKLKQDNFDYSWDEPYLFKICNDGVIRRCVPEEEQMNILDARHSSPNDGHHGGARTASTLLRCGFYWPTLYKDVSELVKRCDSCQRAGEISKKDEMSLTTILEIDIFDVWGIDFMGPFSLPNNEAQSVVAFLKKNIFTRLYFELTGCDLCVGIVCAVQDCCWKDFA